MTRKDGRQRSVAITLPLDPLPWDGNTANPDNPDDNRHSYDVGAELLENGFALEFSPRPGYSQNQEDYA